MVAVPTAQIPGVYHRRIGDIVVTALSDGYLDGTVDVLHNITPAQSSRCWPMRSAGRAAHLGELLPDPFGRPAGADRDRVRRLPGADHGQAAGQPQGRRDRSGCDRIGHPDAHASGSFRRPRQSAHRREILPERRAGGARERAAPLERRRGDGAGAERAKKLYFACAREQMAPYHNVMRTYTGSVEVFPGVTSVPLHGHTPGHCGYMIASARSRC